MDMKTKILIGGAAIAVTGVATYLIVKHAKEKKELEKKNAAKQIPSSTNKSVEENKKETKENNTKEEKPKKETTKSEAKTYPNPKEAKTDNDIIVIEADYKEIDEEDADNTEDNKFNTVEEIEYELYKLIDELDKNSELVDDKSMKTYKNNIKMLLKVCNHVKAKNKNTNQPQQHSNSEEDSAKKATESNSKDEFKYASDSIFSKYLITYYDKGGNKRKPDDKLTSVKDLAIIRAYAIIVKGIKDEKLIEKFIEENSTFEKMVEYNSAILKRLRELHYKKEGIDDLIDTIEFIDKHIDLIRSKNTITVLENAHNLADSIINDKELCCLSYLQVKNSLNNSISILELMITKILDGADHYESEEELMNAAIRELKDIKDGNDIVERAIRYENWEDSDYDFEPDEDRPLLRPDPDLLEKVNAGYYDEDYGEEDDDDDEYEEDDDWDDNDIEDDEEEVLA